MFLPMAAHFAHTTIGARRVRSRRIKRSTIGASWTLAKYGKPEIFNTDQGSQFTSPCFTGTHAEGSGRQDPDGWQGPPSASSYLDAELGVHRTRQPPSQHFPARPIHNRNKLEKAPPHRNVRDVSTPNLVGAINHDILEKAGVDHLSPPVHSRARRPWLKNPVPPPADRAWPATSRHQLHAPSHHRQPSSRKLWIASRSLASSSC
jgi:hypothetical protein